MANLLIKYQAYIEELRKEFYSCSLENAVKCRRESMQPKDKNLVFGFIEGVKKEMHIMDVPNNLRVIL